MNDLLMTHYGQHGGGGLNDHYVHHGADHDDDPCWCLQAEDYPKCPLSARAQLKPELKQFIKSATSSTHNYDL